MILVTGGAGFIGSNLVRALNERGESRILIVDHLNSSLKEQNLTGLRFTDYLDRREFRRQIAARGFERLDLRCIYHQGACSSTVEQDAAYLLDNNYLYARELADFAVARGIPLVYASSAAVYGGSGGFREEPACEHPQNLYAWSKLLLDTYIRGLLPYARTTVVGLRYFNVYGPCEAHKGRMSSAAHQFLKQAREAGVVRLFKGSGGYAHGEQRRDFVYVGDVVRVNLFFGEGPPRHGIYNVGTGSTRTFNDVARQAIALEAAGRIEYIDFPADLEDRYQHFTEADLTQLHAAGWSEAATTLEDGMRLMCAASRAATK